MKRLLTAAAFALIASAANAGDNSCAGTVKVGNGWATVVESADSWCEFRTTTKLGRSILAVCPNGSECLIEMPLPANGLVSASPRTIARITHVERTK